jgi:cytosine deaminase
MKNPVWPNGPRVHLAKVGVPQSLLASDAPGVGDREGVKPVDLIIEHGKIAAILPAGSTPVCAVFDADNGQAWPTFADLHAHLDKGHIIPRAANQDGTIDTARAQTRADTMSRWKAHDVEARFEFALKTAYAHGTSAIRTHIDCFVTAQAPVSFNVFRHLRERWSGRIELQAVALVSPDLYQDPENASIVDDIADADGKLGGIVSRLSESDDPSVIDTRLEHLFALAESRGLDVDLHVDENGSPASTTLAQIAATVLRTGFKGHVVCGHCCSLSVINEDIALRTIQLVKEAGITIVSLPLVNQYLQGRRPGATPRWRGIPLLRELQSAGVTVALASDNCRDPYHAFGDHDLLEVFGGGIRIGHLEAEIDKWTVSVTRNPLSTMGLTEAGLLRPGSAADLVIYRGRTFSEIFARRQGDRMVIRQGKAIDTTPPDFRSLDHLMGAVR